MLNRATFLAILVTAGSTAFASALLGGCSKDCTLIGCANGVSVSVSRPAGFEADTYTVVVTAGDDELRCTEGRVPCGIGELVEFDGELHFRAPLTDAQMEAGVMTVRIESASEGVILEDTEVTFEVEERFPNGPDCDTFPCLNAAVDLDVES